MGWRAVELANGRRFRIGTGFSDVERHNPRTVGTVITFRYRGVTPTGLPSFATFLRVRHDEPGVSAEYASNALLLSARSSSVLYSHSCSATKLLAESVRMLSSRINRRPSSTG